MKKIVSVIFAISILLSFNTVSYAAVHSHEQKFLDDLVVRPFFGFRMYKYNISKKDCFDIFVASSVPNPQTPTIFVQIRSEFL